MDTKLIVILSVLEAVALVVMVRLWLLRHRRMGVVARILWSLMLLVPAFGLIMYAFIHNHPDEHPYHEESGSPDDVGGGDGH